MFEQLFGSKTRVKLLRLFFTNPNRSFYVREITRKVDEQINSVRRELSNLLSIGIIKSDANNNRLYYEVNQDYDFYKPMAMIFGGETAKTAPAISKQAKGKPAEKNEESLPEPPLAKSLRTLGKVELALLTGQFTRDEASGVDVLIVGDVNASKANKFIADLEKAESKELRYAIMTASDFRYRSQIHDRFITNVLGSKNQVIINTNNLISE